MRQLKTSIPDGGAPLGQFPVFNQLFGADLIGGYESILASLVDSETEGVILSGCVVSGGGPYNVSAGYVYQDGKIRKYAGATGITLPRYIVASDSEEGGSFQDGVNRNYIDVFAATDSASQSGQYITLSASTRRDLNSLILIRRAAGIDAISKKITNLANGTNPGDAVNKGQLDTKPTIDDFSGFVTATLSGPVSSGTVSYKKTSYGLVIVSLGITLNGSAGTLATVGTNMPSGSKTNREFIGYVFSGLTEYSARFTFQSDGDIIIQAIENGASLVNLNNYNARLYTIYHPTA